MLLINLCLFSSLCHYRKFLFDRKHRWVQEKLVLLFHFPDRYLLSHANPLTPVTTSEPPTLFTITNVIIIIQGNDASTLGTHSHCCVYNSAFCNHLSLNFKTFIWDLFKEFFTEIIRKTHNPVKIVGILCIYKYFKCIQELYNLFGLIWWLLEMHGLCRQWNTLCTTKEQQKCKGWCSHVKTIHYLLHLFLWPQNCFHGAMCKGHETVWLPRSGFGSSCEDHFMFLSKSTTANLGAGT